MTYYNAFASFTDEKTLRCVDADGAELTLTADTFVLAPGGRPRLPEIPGARELGVSSDDIFSLAKPPGKTLVIGASYVALECAGFLRGLGCETAVMVRSVALRSWFKMAATLSDDTAPSASLDCLKAQAAPTHPRAQPEPAWKLTVASGARLRPAQS